MLDFKKLDLLNKGQIKAELDALSDQFPALREISPDTMTKKEMLAAAAVALANTPPAPVPDDKRGAVDRVISERPDAVLLPVDQIVYRINHPRQTGVSFEISALDSTEATILVSPAELRRGPRAPGGGQPVTRRLPSATATIHAATRLADVPAWAREAVYDAADRGELRIFASLEEATKSADPVSLKTGTLLDTDLATVGMRLVPNEGSTLSDEFKPLTVEPRAQFSRVEQQAAWNVLNGTVRGEGPLPQSTRDLASDPRVLTSAEIDHVRNRIMRCLVQPGPFIDGKPSAAFDKRVFFNQLLELEYSGFTPPRPQSVNKTGGTRPAIIKVIREQAQEAGFMVLGDYVTPKPSAEAPADVMPTVPLRSNADSDT